MNIQELKNQIELKCVTDKPLIFIDDENMFLSNQYIKAISEIRNLKINYISSIEEALPDTSSFFVVDTTDYGTSLNVLKSQVYEWGERDFTRTNNLIVVVNKFENKDVEASLSDYVVRMPKLEGWQIRDYVLSICEGVAQKDLEWLINLCGGNICRLQQEIDKLTLFSVPERKYLFDSFIRDGAVDDLSSFNIFNFSNALISKDFEALKSIYKELSRMDVNEFGLLTILLTNFKNLILVKLNSNPTPETTGLDGKRLYAIKKTPNAYSANQLIDIFTFLADIDRKIKSGELPTEILIDYMLIKILSA